MDEREKELRALVVAVAHSFLRTPYADCATVKGPNGGVDCATSLWMIYREAGLEVPESLPTYYPQWYLHQGAELYLDHVKAYAFEIAEAEAIDADIVVYQFGRCFAHGAVIVDPGFPTIIHAHKQAGCVTLGEGLGGDLAVVRVGDRYKPRPRKFFRHKRWSR